MNLSKLVLTVCLSSCAYASDVIVKSENVAPQIVQQPQYIIVIIEVRYIPSYQQSYYPQQSYSYYPQQSYIQH